MKGVNACNVARVRGSGDAVSVSAALHIAINQQISGVEEVASRQAI